MSKLRIHVIAIGGGVMHSMAVNLKAQGHEVSGSDDVIYSPAKDVLVSHGLYPERMGWDASRITQELDFVLLGMHAKADNPEVLRAQALGIPIYDYPSFVRRQCANKQRVVITGSYGKTTTTALVMHVLRYHKRPFDYVIGAPVPGFEGTVKLTDAPLVIIEGDEYPASRLNPVPKLNIYEHHIGLLSGISWDHVNFYPEWEGYIQIFERFADHTPKAGILIYNAEKDLTSLIGKKPRTDVQSIGYECPEHVVEGDRTYLIHKNERIPLSIFGRHNLMNIEGARLVLKALAISRSEFYEAIASFTGAHGRLSLVQKGGYTRIYRDFAHAPAKVKATVEAMRMQFPHQPLVAILELCTYSSLTENFLPHYRNTLGQAQVALVYVNPDILNHRSDAHINQQKLQQHFNNQALIYLNDKAQIAEALAPYAHNNHHFLFMSSSNFGGLDLSGIAQQLCPQPNTSPSSSL